MCTLQAKLEDMTQKEEWARTQFESIASNVGSIRRTNQKCHELQAENKQLFEQLTKLNGLNDDNVTLVNEVKAQVRKLEQELQIAKIEVCIQPC